jgi:hypothetical protein
MKFSWRVNGFVLFSNENSKGKNNVAKKTLPKRMQQLHFPPSVMRMLLTEGSSAVSEETLSSEETPALGDAIKTSHCRHNIKTNHYPGQRPSKPPTKKGDSK